VLGADEAAEVANEDPALDAAFGQVA